MEGYSKQLETKTEMVPNTPGAAPIEKKPLTPAPVQVPERTSAERSKIEKIKEKLLANGEMTIEALEGDPFILTRDHVATGEGVTTYRPDGSIKKQTIAEYKAKLARGQAAARFFERSRGRYRSRKQLNRKGKGIAMWFKSVFSFLFSKS